MNRSLILQIGTTICGLAALFFLPKAIADDDQMPAAGAIKIYENNVNKKIPSGTGAIVVDGKMFAVKNRDGTITLSAECHVDNLPLHSLGALGHFVIYPGNKNSFSPFEGSFYNGYKDFALKLCFFSKYNKDHSHASIQPYVLVTNDFLTTNELVHTGGVVDLKDDTALGMITKLCGKKVIVFEPLGSFDIDLKN